LIVAPSVACYLYYSQYLLLQNKRIVEKTHSCGDLSYWTDFVHRLSLGDIVQEYADSIFHCLWRK